MSIITVREYLKKFDKDQNIIELKQSTATVQLAALALGVEPARIAKTLSFKDKEGAIIVVVAGDTKVDNKKFKTTFGLKAKMLSPDEVIEFTGHKIGGVCPFGITKNNTKIYLDESLKRFQTVFPACGSSNSAIELSCEELENLCSISGWVDVCSF